MSREARRRQKSGGALPWGKGTASGAPVEAAGLGKLGWVKWKWGILCDWVGDDYFTFLVGSRLYMGVKIREAVSC